MSKQLLESDFLTVDFQSLLSKSKSVNNQDTATTTDTEIKKPANSSNNASNLNNFDWGKELENRLTANKNMSIESRENEYDIETKFFSEFFNANWDSVSAKNLMLIGDLLRKDIKILGFKKKTNPILAFLSLKYVKEELLQTKLLNINTYKALHHAYANRWIADSEFFKANDYNIIYCKDLYKKSLNEIEEYLKLQTEVTLKPKSPVYTLETQIINKKIFLYTAKNTAINMDDRVNQQLALNIKFLSMKSKNAILNDFKFAEAIRNKIARSTSGQGNTGARTHTKNMGTRTLGELANKFNNDPAKVLAFLQYFSITTGNEKAMQALSHEKLRDVSVEQLKKATAQISEFVPQTKLSLDDAKILIDVLLGNLD